MTNDIFLNHKTKILKHTITNMIWFRIQKKLSIKNIFSIPEKVIMEICKYTEK